MTDREEPPQQPPALIDRSVKALIRAVPEALFRLAGVQADRRDVRFEDIALNLPEHRADHVLLHGAEGDPARWAMHAEYQLQPDPSVMPGKSLRRCSPCAKIVQQSRRCGTSARSS